MPRTEALLRDIQGALLRKHNVLLYGPPGTGKSYLMNQIRRWFMYPPPRMYLSPTDSDFVQELPNKDRPYRMSWWITFHQSYTYENFVIGLVPEAAPGGMGLVFRSIHGPLLEAAENARLLDGQSLLLLDEVNRGNTSRIFGDFITVMEAPKRLDEHGRATDETVEIRLPNIPVAGLSFALKRPDGSTRGVVVSASFAMPRHVYTLASMNSVDRSVAPLDAAMRRRFHIIRLDPDYELLAEEFGLAPDLPDWYRVLASNPSDLTYWRKLAIRLLYAINNRITATQGEDFQIGHAALVGLKEVGVASFSDYLARDVWEGQLLPQLQELLRGDTQLLGSALRAVEDGDRTQFPYRYQEQPAELLEARPALKILRIADSQIEMVLRRLASVEAPGGGDGGLASEPPGQTNPPAVAAVDAQTEPSADATPIA